jgi:hypothetical protein
MRLHPTITHKTKAAVPSLLTLAIGALALSCLPPAKSRADTILGMQAFSGPNYFWTDRMDLIDVRLHRNWPISDEHASLRIPRGYIFFVSERPKSGASLPQQIDVRSLYVALIHGSAEPYRARLNDLNKKTNFDSSVSNMLRAEVALVALNYSVVPAKVLLERYKKPYFVDRGSFEGLVVTKDGTYGSAIDLYSPNDTEEFVDANCFEPARPIFWCQYRFEVCKHVHARASFMDLRLHGGLPYANDRVRFLKATIRSWIKSCDTSETLKAR